MPHHIVNLLRDALVHYGYWAVAAMLLLESAGLPLPGETILLLASFLLIPNTSCDFPGSLWLALRPRRSAENLVLLLAATEGGR